MSGFFVLKVGDKVAGYEIVAELKSGGMATLYLGRRGGAAGFAKHVAIKVIHPHLGKDDKFVNMFLDEARLSARIEHPSVVHVHDLGESDGMYFMVMEYVNGCSLAQLCRALAERGRKMSTELSTWVAIRVAQGLHAAHELTDDAGQPLGVVHRDVSPQNVLVAYKGYVKLIDFGIAKAAGRSQHTTTGLLKGKFRYMAPEQAGGKPVDRRCDVYALGVMLWEMITMRKLFDAENELALLDQVRNPQVAPPSRYAPEIPPALDQVVMRALAVDKENRPATAHAFAQELARAVPAALSVDTPQLSQLVRTVMATVIEGDKKSLPESLSGVLMSGTERPKEGEKVVEEMTMSLSTGDLQAPSSPGTAARVAAPPPAPVAPRPASVSHLPDAPVAPHAMAPRRDSAYPNTLILDGQAALAPMNDATPAPGTSSGVVRVDPMDAAQAAALGHAGQATGGYAAQSTGGYVAQPAPKKSHAPIIAAVLAVALLGVIGVGVAVALFVMRGSDEPTVIQLDEPNPPVAQPPEAPPGPEVEEPEGPTAEDLAARQAEVEAAAERAREAAREVEEAERQEAEARAREEERRAARDRERETRMTRMTRMTSTDDVPIIDDVTF